VEEEEGSRGGKKRREEEGDKEGIEEVETNGSG